MVVASARDNANIGKNAKSSTALLFFTKGPSRCRAMFRPLSPFAPRRDFRRKGPRDVAKRVDRRRGHRGGGSRVSPARIWLQRAAASQEIAGLDQAEILPPEARAQIESLSWQGVFDHAGATTVEGFENCWNLDDTVVKPGVFLHVERTALARWRLNFAQERGARVQDLRELPPLGPEDAEGISLKEQGLERRFLAAIDATGRAAAWSRPVERQDRHVAQLFEGPPCPSSLRGRVVADRGGKRRAYRVGLPGSISVGIIGSGQSRTELGPSLAQSLDLPAAQFRYVGRRPAFTQWAVEPACGRRFAVGDAAFASDPLAGQGIRFAMASGIAAAAAVNSLAQSDGAPLALDYYRNFVNSAAPPPRRMARPPPRRPGCAPSAVDRSRHPPLHRAPPTNGA